MGRSYIAGALYLHVTQGAFTKHYEQEMNHIVDNAVRILLAEDDEDEAFFFRRAVKLNPQVKLIWHAKDGDEAIEYLSGAGRFGNRVEYEFPDVLVLDLNMPVRNGFEVLEWLRGKFPQLKVGVFSSSEELEAIEKARKLGAHLYQPKTYEPEAFGRFVHWLESLARGERKAEAACETLKAAGP